MAATKARLRRRTKYWLIKSEPDVYGYPQLEKDRRTEWTGIRNFEARNNLRAMSPGDLCLYYHTGDDKAVVGVVEVVNAARPDSTAPKDEDWSSVEVAPVVALAHPVPLSEIKRSPALATFQLVTRPRLSVVPAEPSHFTTILRMAKTKVPGAGAARRRSPPSRR